MKSTEMPPAAIKESLREELRGRLRAMTPESRADGSRCILEACRDMPEWVRCRSVALYHPRTDEPDLWPLVESSWAEGRTVVLPSCDDSGDAYRWRRVTGPDDMVPGRFGILEPRRHCEPVDAERLDLAFVPGLGFSTDGGRLGRGKGFYDRLLQSLGGSRFGVAFAFQMLPQVPREGHDVLLDGVVTPSGCRYATSGVPQRNGH